MEGVSEGIILSEVQEAAVQSVVDWYKQTVQSLNIKPFDAWCKDSGKSPDDGAARISYVGYMQRRGRNVNSKFFNLFGFAGTGKSTIAKEIERRLGVIVQYIAPTGRAASILRRKGCDAITMHKFAYIPLGEDDEGQLIFGPRLDPATMPQLIILDEGSMVSERDAAQLLSFGIPILVLADTGQVDPVRGKGGFTSLPHNVLLTEVRRQDLDSKILHAATIVRQGSNVPDRKYDDIHIQTAQPKISDFLNYIGEDSQIVVVRNHTRIRINNGVRAARVRMGELDKSSLGKFPALDLPVKGDKLIATFNNYPDDVMNGSQWLAVSDCYENKDAELYDVEWESQQGMRSAMGTRPMLIDVVSMDGTSTFKTLAINPDCFFVGTDPEALARRKEGAKRVGGFDFGYAITVHKAQGGEWERVLFVEESLPSMDMRKIVYTAITRAQKFFDWYR